MAKTPTDGDARDWSETLFLPKTDFPMKAGLPEREPQLLERWAKLGLYARMREDAKGRTPYVLHDGPPYANGNIHIGHALNKIFKDVIVRSHQMMGRDANYVPGWDCHGLPIEWKVEEQYRAKGKSKDEVPVVEFRRECRDFAAHWVDVQREEFKRLGVEGDWANPYTTMTFEAEAIIARELMKFALNGTLYLGSKPVMWSVVERTALAEAEVEYQEIVSSTVFVKFPIFRAYELEAAGNGAVTERDAKKGVADRGLAGASIVIWTTTPWTIPANRAISYSKDIAYGLYEVTEVPEDKWAKTGDHYVLADALAENVLKAAGVEKAERIKDVRVDELKGLIAVHPLHERGFDGFEVPLVAADYVTEDTGTGFVHTAPGHGADDFETFRKNQDAFKVGGTREVPHTVGPDGYYVETVPLFGGTSPKRVIDDKGKFGDANEAVIKALVDASMVIAQGKLRHDYPHSWRSKAPVIFRNTPQWFIAMDKPISDPTRREQGELHLDTALPPFQAATALGVEPEPPSDGPNASDLSAYLQAAFESSSFGGSAQTLGKSTDTLRARALAAIGKTHWVPPQSKNRITGMVETRPDWVISRQRAWGVPITVFRNVNPASPSHGHVVPGPHHSRSAELTSRIVRAFAEEGADAWFAEGATERFLGGLVEDPVDWAKVDDILDVWFDSGSTHAFVLERRPDLSWPADLYVEGADQHRGWFQSSLMESCGTRGRAPYDGVLTHGFVMHEDGRKMSKSLGNVVAPQDVIRQSGAEILRLWAMNSDYADDMRIGPEILKSNVESYRKLRNTLRFLLGNLAHYEKSLRVEPADMPELERVILHRLAELDRIVRQGLVDFEFKRVFTALFNFAVNDLSAFYFDIRKDALYCDAYDSPVRRAALTVLDEVFGCLTAWLAPMLCFTMEEAWLTRFPSDQGSVHLRQFPAIPASWQDEALAEKWKRVRTVRRVVTGALEVERREKRIGSSLEAAPKVFVADGALRDALDGVDLAEIAITSQATLADGEGPAEAFRLADVPGVAVLPRLAEGKKCARSWKILTEVGSDPGFPDLSPRDADAVRQFDARRKAA